MESSKIKNIIIAILLGLNFFLAVLVALDYSESAGAAASAAESAETALGKYGVGLSDKIDITEAAPTAYTVRRDMDKELKLMQELLGSVRSEDLGGNIRYYSSSSGQASARGTGELDILFTSSSISRGRNPISTAAKTLKQLGGEGCEERASAVSSGGSTIVEMPYTFSGLTVFNSHMTLTFGQSDLLMISGVRLFDTATADEEAYAMNALTAIVRFAEVIGENGYVCSELQKLEAGYIMSVTVSGESTLTPVWHFVTDTGSIYINAATGSIESL